jgi:hypothetical protein
MIKKISVNNYNYPPYMQNKTSFQNRNLVYKKINQTESAISFCGVNWTNVKTNAIKGGLAIVPGAIPVAAILLFLGSSTQLASTKTAKFLNNSESYKILKNEAGKILKFINIFDRNLGS